MTGTLVTQIYTRGKGQFPNENGLAEAIHQNAQKAIRPRDFRLFSTAERPKRTALQPTAAIPVLYSGSGVASQIRTVMSEEALIKRCPSGLNARPVTMLVCPFSVRVSCPVVRSQTFTVPPKTRRGQAFAIGAEF